MARDIKYKLPEFLKNVVYRNKYANWLGLKAKFYVKRDRNLGNDDASVEEYKQALHAAVCASNGLDDYTGQGLRWDLLGQHVNSYKDDKKELDQAPSADRVGDARSDPEFKICARVTNNAKGSLSEQDFLDLCRHVVDHARRAHSSR